jgi:hypothetical protein
VSPLRGVAPLRSWEWTLTTDCVVFAVTKRHLGKRRVIGGLVIPTLFAVGVLLFSVGRESVASHDTKSPATLGTEFADAFAYLSPRGNSNCSTAFTQSIASMPDDDTIRGSCCGPMSLHVYTEQRRGIEAKFGQLLEVPQDPYNIRASIAKRMLPRYDDVLTREQQSTYDYAMAHSNNKGPCCCPCWRWTFYGGLAKYAIETYGLSGEQVTELWNFSDGCGGEEEHVYHG